MELEEARPGPARGQGEGNLMSDIQAVSQPNTNFKSKVLFAPLGPIARYHLRYTLLLTAIPLICGTILTALLTVFAKLNLYFLESNGLLVDDQVREAYFNQVQIEVFNMVGHIGLHLFVTLVVAIVVMRWSSAPFLSAFRTVETALDKPEKLQPSVRWLSESPFFDRIIWLFSLRVKSGGENQVKKVEGDHITNFLFFGKFVLTFGVLSLLAGYTMGSTIGSIYERIVSLGVQLISRGNVSQAQHYFIAQAEILQDASFYMTLVSFGANLVVGWTISRNMATMIQVFSRALEEDRFPIQLRTNDIYHNLAHILNRARERIR
jgi:hypothetical protein